MKIEDFTNLIKELPVAHHSFDVKKNNWENFHQQNIIDKIIPGDMITISRLDLFYHHWDTKEFILKVLMWGYVYPAKGRGNNINNIFKPDHFNQLVKALDQLKESKIISMSDLKEILKIPGVGLSTLTKFLYFLSLKIDNHKALILDNRVINAITKFEDEELKTLHGISYRTGFLNYIDYLSSMDKLSSSMSVEPDQIEMFLYLFGGNLKEPVGEDGDWSSLEE